MFSNTLVYTHNILSTYFVVGVGYVHSKFSFFLSFFINPKQKNSKLRSFSLSLPHTTTKRSRAPCVCRRRLRRGERPCASSSSSSSFREASSSSSSSSRVDDDDVVFSRQRPLLKVVVVKVVCGTPSSDSMSSF